MQSKKLSSQNLSASQKHQITWHLLIYWVPRIDAAWFQGSCVRVITWNKVVVSLRYYMIKLMNLCGNSARLREKLDISRRSLNFFLHDGLTRKQKNRRLNFLPTHFFCLYIDLHRRRKKCIYEILDLTLKGDKCTLRKKSISLPHGKFIHLENEI